MYTRSFNRVNGSKPRQFLFRSSQFRKSSGASIRGQRGENIDPSKFINKAVKFEGPDHFISEHKFQDFKVDQRLIQAVVMKGYKTPTPIQDQAIPHILNGSDLVNNPCPKCKEAQELLKYDSNKSALWELNYRLINN